MKTASLDARPVGDAGHGRPSPVRWWAAFTHRGYNCFQGARFLSMLGMQMQSVAVGWQVYAITHRPIALAWVGLAQFFPAAGLSLITGQVADRFDRRRIMMVCHAAMTALSLSLLLAAGAETTHLASIYGLLVAIGVARAFLGPATQSILPSLVPLEHFGNAVTWASSLMQTAMVLGPMVGGLVYAAAAGPAAVYGSAAACSTGALALVGAMGQSTAAAPAGSARVTERASVLAGVRYVWSNPIVLGAISLDLFAVLLGGATALLPIYARDILHLGPSALGALRSAPAAGAAVTGVLLALRPIEARAGAKMLGCVAVFGLATIAFGLSSNLALSLFALVIAGSTDMVSVVVRSALVQLATPPAMRGRVSAVNMVFIGASNELGEFESGLTAQWLGAVSSVVLGGIGTLVVVAIWMRRFPQLRRVNRLTDVMPAS
ncbi:MAG TPA: MFS transporter [Polyangiaceae bacterium]|nr:MFS transporter [Polyangiaceae bacterium]